MISNGLPDRALTHAGGAVLRAHAGKNHILLVRAKPAPHDWVLPKGHIERGEAAEDAARREVQEEAGVDAEPICYLGLIEFDSPKGEHVRAGFLFMTFKSTVPPAEKRETRWCPIDEALELIRFEDMRGIIRGADLASAKMRP
jgi:8-oxo-dGTP pyrophosphatase MutT (NUDIX family)